MSIQNRINKFFQELDALEKIPTASAFCQAREKIKPELFKALNEETVKPFYEYYEREGLVTRWKGRLLWAVDGSSLNLPSTSETREKYSVQTNQYDEEGGVQALASFLYDVLNEVVINSVIDKKRSEKSFIFEEHSKYYHDEAVIIYDRLYADYSVMAFHAKEGIDFIIRCPLSKRFKEVEEFVRSDKTDEIVNLRVTRKQRGFVEEHRLPEEIKVRLVKVQLENNEIEVLITSLLDKERYTLEDFKWAYKKRWGIETYLDRLKNRLEVEKFSSKKARGIEQDFYGVVFLSTLESVLSKEEEEEVRERSQENGLKYEYKINKSVSYAALVDHVVDLLLDSEKSLSETESELRKMFRGSLVPERPGRQVKRKEGTTSRKLRFQKYAKRVWA
jgi:hypothetical protein